MSAPTHDRTPSSSPAAPGLRAWLGAEIASLNPGCFALVMATGIISNAFWFEGRPELSDALLAANLIAYPWLMAVTIVRAIRFGPALGRDLLDPRVVFSFFTIVAATDVLGMAINLRGFAAAATALWFCALAVWLVLTY